ncbi:MAG: hypothetical protein CW341_07475 [Bacteroidetes bacterium]|nr:hypothetical protein [Bacteroidota bacterium]
MLAEAAAQTCPFKVRFDTISATCYNNGKVLYALVDDGGNALSTVPGDLTNVRIYYKTSESDTAYFGNHYYTGGWDTLTIDYGTYTIGMEAACPDGGGGFVKLDTHTVLTINTTYSKPKAAALYVTAQSKDDYGKHPTLNCVNSGRIQLKIQDGRFPYTVTVRDHSTHDSLRTVVFDDYMYSGTDETKYNYKYYYTVDSLPVGTWEFYVVDGCDYGLPRTIQTVSEISLPKLSEIEVFASSGNFADSNVVKINAVLDQYYGYYNDLLTGYVQYRFLYNGTPNGGWKNFMANPDSKKTTLKDTATGYNRYCDLWGDNITFEYKVNGCGLNETISKTFQYNQPNPSDFHKDVAYKDDSALVAVNTCGTKSYYHTSSYSIAYYRTNHSYSPNHTSIDNDDNTYAFYRYHYTHPLTWLYIDTNTGDTIKRDAVASINNASNLTENEVIALYGSFATTPLTINVKRTLVDARGCTLYSTTDNLTYQYTSSTGNPHWLIDRYGNDHCANVKRSVSVWEENYQPYNTGTTTIKLVRSPYNDRYNFTAVFDHATQTWSITKAQLINTAEIAGGSGGHSVAIRAFGLPSGPYRFRIESPCDTVVLYKEYGFPDIYSTEMTEEPVLQYHQECTDRYIKYTAGQYARVARNTSPSTGLDLPPVYMNLNTKFVIEKGPVGGFGATAHAMKTDSARISIPGEYIIRIYPDVNVNEVCNLPSYYDTIFYDGATVEFEYAYALLCDNTCTSGNIFVKGINGTEPYTYTLYSEKDKEGAVLGTNSTGEFMNVPVTAGSLLSCKVEDACGSYYHINITPSILAEMQKIWFENGLKETTTCEGTTIKVNALKMGPSIYYQWEGPNGFIATTTDTAIFLPRHADDGWYRVTVMNTGCGMAITDSILLHLNEAPSISLTGGGTVCPGEEVTVQFSPSSTYNTSTDIFFTIAFTNATGTETRDYSSLSGNSVSDIYATNTDAKIYPVSINDGRCDYTLADASDTIYVYTRKDISNSCHLFTQHDTACYDGNVVLKAQSDLTPPYTLRWYEDYGLTKLRQEDVINNATDWSEYDTNHIISRSMLYVSVSREGSCPTVYGVPTHSVNMSDGATTTMDCGQTYSFYDAGGATGDYAASSDILIHRFTTAGGQRVALHFEKLDLSTSAALVVISGGQALVDSALCTLTSGSANPGMILSKGDTITLLFSGGLSSAAGWSAIVEPMPGIAIADVWPENKVTIYDEVCQSQTNTYDDIYHIAPDVTDMVSLNNAIKKAGSYKFTKTLAGADRHHCDSTVTFILTVTPPDHYDTTIVTTNLHGGSCIWHGTTYIKSGRYSFLTPLPDGCDSLDILDFIVLQVDTSTNEFCEGDSTTMGVMVTEPEMTWKDDLIPPTVNIGDVMCTDGTTMNVDTFVKYYPEHGKFPMGVVFFVDNTGLHGLVVALRDACERQVWSKWNTWGNYSTHKPMVKSLTITTNAITAMSDINGFGNTQKIKQTAEIVGPRDFSYNAPVIYACFYYNHNTLSVGTDSLGWYMPALGELNMLWMNRKESCISLKKLSTINSAITQLSSYGSYAYTAYLSSTLYDDL